LTPDGNLVIVGASVRAAAFSALRAGLRPWCADLFADLDLQGRCTVTCLAGRYPDGFLPLVDSAPVGPWMYTGGLENRPKLVARLARRRPLWGNGAAVLARARDPFFVHSLLWAAGLPVPAVFAPQDSVPSGPRWLRKPIRGAGGAGVRFWVPAGALAPARGPAYLQEFIEGQPCAALYAGDGRGALLLGLTYQLVGTPLLHAGPFRYCGSLGPLEPDHALQEELTRLGNVLAAGCGLRGLFGVDGVLRDGAFWPVEVNPRYTASVEVLEYATGVPALGWHRAAFTPGDAAVPPPAHGPLIRRVGKAILFAPKNIVFRADGPWCAELLAPPPLTEVPAFADVPAAGEPIAAGRPVLTIFAQGDSTAACADRLRQIAADLARWLFGR